LLSENVTDQTSWAIYGMRHKDEAEYRYIGLTRVGIERRLKLHKTDAQKAKRYVSNWVNKNTDDVVIEVIEECPVGDEAYLFDAEVRWIKHYRDLGHQLTNLSDGGASGSFGARWVISDDVRRKGMDAPFYGRFHTPASRGAISLGKTGTKRSAESRRKQGESIRGDKHWTKRSPGYVMPAEVRQKIREARKNQAPMSDETRRKISDGNRGKTLSPETRAKISASISGEAHHAYGKAAVNKGVPMSEAQKEKLKESRPQARCFSWHGKRNYVDPDCEVCGSKVASGEAERFSTPEEIATAKAVWKAGRDTTELSAKLSAQREGRVTSDETKAKLSAAKKGVKKGPFSDEHRAKLSAAKKGRVISEETKLKMRMGHHKRHADRGITKPGCEFCIQA
jgi:hypothetical protein